MQIGLVCLLRSFEAMPAAVLGHSSGEIAAAYAAGLISFYSALANAFFRGRAAKEVAEDANVHGAMLALGADAKQAARLLPTSASGGCATIAAYNSPGSVTLSGDASAIDQIHAEAEEKGIFSRKLRVGVAYHSSHMS